MTNATLRDEAWHAAIITAIEAGRAGSFRAEDVVETAAELNCTVSRRTITKVLGVMGDLGYLDERKKGTYAPDGPLQVDFAVDLVGLVEDLEVVEP